MLSDPFSSSFKELSSTSFASTEPSLSVARSFLEIKRLIERVDFNLIWGHHDTQQILMAKYDNLVDAFREEGKKRGCDSRSLGSFDVLYPHTQSKLALKIIEGALSKIASFYDFSFKTADLNEFLYPKPTTKESSLRDFKQIEEISQLLRHPISRADLLRYRKTVNITCRVLGVKSPTGANSHVFGFTLLKSTKQSIVMEAIAVSSDKQRMGYGRQLLQDAKDQFDSSQKIRLMVGRHQFTSAAEMFFRVNGFHYDQMHGAYVFHAKK